MDLDGHGMPHMPSHEHGNPDAMACSMSMVWNTATQGMCVVFPSWHVVNRQSFVTTLIALFIIAMLLERIRYEIRALDGKLIMQHRIDYPYLNMWTSSAREHRRKASVQQVLVGNGMSRSPLKADGALGGPALVSGLAFGERRASPSSHIQGSDSASFGSRSDDDAPLLPSAYTKSRKTPSSLTQKMSQKLM